ncbi:MAG: Asp23/Gls24 family envelope stress response protein [Lachnospiraceae bacterium]|nr:Asp23/Gls24 family envelope stress response protein [Lachnospiraceae bacterium]
MSKEYKSESVTLQGECSGELKIANEVVAIIAALAATEVDGVVSLVGNMTHELIAKLGMKNLSKGISVTVEDGIVHTQVSLVIQYGYSVPEVSAKVQDKIKTAIENMTGLQVESVRVTIAGVNM